ncbi:YesK family protein [Oceanobacillus damuensis]|uniref:YesK family protein n=1 Tax=Oceanobacillus damuensis TaxID=937928 RepID=UPI000833A273|nr:YesK family protein [Oceanobacillus damuensis]
MIEGLEIFYFIFLGVTAFIIILTRISKRYLPEQSYYMFVSAGYAAITFVSLTIIFVSFTVMGWKGMGFGLLGLSILAGTVSAIIINGCMTFFFGR